MKLLFDHNLSHKLVLRLADIFPDSTQTQLLGLSTANDSTIWQYANDNSFVVVTLDKDFADLALHRGAPPKIIWLRCGNSTSPKLNICCAQILRRFRNLIPPPRRACWKSGRKTPRHSN